MSEDLLYGVVAVLLGLALALGSGRFARWFTERQDEQLENPLMRKIHAATERSAPRLMRGRRSRAIFNRIWFAVVGLALCWIGVQLIARGV